MNKIIITHILPYFNILFVREVLFSPRREFQAVCTALYARYAPWVPSQNMHRPLCTVCTVSSKPKYAPPFMHGMHREFPAKVCTALYARYAPWVPSHMHRTFCTVCTVSSEPKYAPRFICAVCTMSSKPKYAPRFICAVCTVSSKPKYAPNFVSF